MDSRHPVQQIKQLCPGAVLERGQLNRSGEPIAWIEQKELIQVAQKISTDPELSFDWLENILTFEVEGNLVLSYLLRSSASGQALILRISTPQDQEGPGEFCSVSRIWPSALGPEHDLEQRLGLRFSGRREMARVAHAPRQGESAATIEYGPLSGKVPGIAHWRIDPDGDRVKKLSVETGFLNRQIEKHLQSAEWPSIIPLVDRIDSTSASFFEFVVCLAVENLAGVDVPPRAKIIRIIVSELSRISSHLSYLATLGRALGSEAQFHFALRDREKLLDLLELLTGSRFGFGYFIFGGVRFNVTEGFVERVLEYLDALQFRITEYNDLCTYGAVSSSRLAGLAAVSPEFARKHALTGPNARAAGVTTDIRREFPYSAYDAFDFDIPIGRGEGAAPGDAVDRQITRLREVQESARILSQALARIPPGAHRVEPFVVPKGESFTRVESPRGLLSCYLLSEGGPTPSRIQFGVPGTNYVGVVPELAKRVPIEDLEILMAGLDLGLPEVDR